MDQCPWEADSYLTGQEITHNLQGSLHWLQEPTTGSHTEPTESSDITIIYH
jgi:hypothetical protein